MTATTARQSIDADPSALEFVPATTALIVVDMQRDFLDPGGFGAALGNDVSSLQQAVEPTRDVLELARAAGLTVVFTREGHAAHLADCPANKRDHASEELTIGDQGPMGRVLVRGEPGHEIIESLSPSRDEIVVDKPGKGAFYATDLDLILRTAEVETLIVTGVTTEVCVHSTIREATDRGYDCLLLEDCVASYDDTFHRVGVEMVSAQGGLFGWVADSERLRSALDGALPESEKATTGGPPRE